MAKLNRFILPIATAALLSLGLVTALSAQAQHRGGWGQHNNNDRMEQRMDRDGGYHRGGRQHRNGSQMRGHRGGHMGGYYGSDYMVSLISPAEVDNYRAQMRVATTVEECKKIESAHRSLIEKRAGEMKVEAPKPRFDVCAEMESSGRFSR